MEPLSRVTAATVDVLRVLVETKESCWGLQVIKSSGRPAGSVYPILERLESMGWVRSFWDTADARPGPRRRYYALIDGGAVLAEAAVRDFSQRVPRRAKETRFITAPAVNA